MNYQDKENLELFVQGMKQSIRKTIEKGDIFIDELPRVVVFLLKRKDETGEVNYGMGGGAVPDDFLGGLLFMGVTESVIKSQGGEIICMCESFYHEESKQMKMLFVNKMTDENTEYTLLVDEQPSTINNEGEIERHCFVTEL